jgi:hypothetical protein
MKRFSIFFGLCLVMAMIVFQPGAIRGHDRNREDRWHEDVNYLWQQIQSIHPDPFRVTSEPVFAQMVSDLDANIPSLSDEQIVVGLFKIIAALRDGHSWIGFTQSGYSFRYYPLYFYPFSDGVYLIQAAPEYTDWVGARLVKIGTTDTAEVMEQLEALAPRDNDFSGLVTLPMRLSNADVLVGTGILADADQAAYRLERSDGEQITLKPEAELFSAFSESIPLQWRLPQAATPMSLSRVDEAFWWTTLNEGKALYVQYNQVIGRDSQSGKTISAFKDDLQAALTATPVERVILDLRYNAGGDINTARPLRNFFSGDDFFKSTGHLIVLTGRNTFSAGVLFSLWLEQDVHPIFAGEATGGRPLMFENAREITLPNSHLHGQIAARARHDNPAGDPRQSIEPQIAAALSSADYFNHADPVLTLALAYPAS